MLELAPDPSRRARLLYGLGLARLRAGDTRARATLLEAAEAARGIGDAGLVAEVALCFGALVLSPGLVDRELVALLEEALDGVGEEPTARRSRLLSRLAVALYWSQEDKRRRALADEAVAIARETGDAAALAFSLANQQLVRGGPDTTERDLETLAELLVLTRRTGDRDLELTARSRHIDLLLELDDLAGADAAIAALAEATAERGDPRARAYVPLHRSRQALTEGHFDEAAELTAQAEHIGAHLRDSTVPMLVLTQGLLMRWIHGRLGEAVDQLRDLAAALPAVFALRAALALAYAGLGRAGEARGEIDAMAPATLPRNAIHVLSLAFLSEAVAELGDARRAEPLYAAFEPFVGRNVTSPAASFAGPATRYLALLAATRGDWTAAHAHFAAARDATTRQHARPLHARLDLDEARLLDRTGREPRRAAELAAGAARKAAILGMPAIEEAAAGLARLRTPRAAEDRRAPGRPDGEAGRGVLRRERGGWAVELDERCVHVGDNEGVRLIAALLARPGEGVLATDLAPAEADSGAPPLDEAALAALRQRLDDLREEEDEALADHDPAGVARVRAEIDLIERELAGDAVDGRWPSAAERARVRVTRAIRLATREIGEQDRGLGRELDAAISTGTVCAHEPRPRHPVRWSVDA